MRKAFGSNRFAQMRDRCRIAEKILKAHEFEFNGRLRWSVDWFAGFGGGLWMFRSQKDENALKQGRNRRFPPGLKCSKPADRKGDPRHPNTCEDFCRCFVDSRC